MAFLNIIRYLSLVIFHLTASLIHFAEHNPWFQRVSSQYMPSKWVGNVGINAVEYYHFADNILYIASLDPVENQIILAYLSLDNDNSFSFYIWVNVDGQGILKHKHHSPHYKGLLEYDTYISCLVQVNNTVGLLLPDYKGLSHTLCIILVKPLCSNPLYEGLNNPLLDIMLFKLAMTTALLDAMYKFTG
jgi:hypothetical protein